MNISQKCNCCCKEEVCKYSEKYKSTCENLKDIVSLQSVAEISISCKFFKANEPTPRVVIK